MPTAPGPLFRIWSILTWKTSWLRINLNGNLRNRYRPNVLWILVSISSIDDTVVTDSLWMISSMVGVVVMMFDCFIQVLGSKHIRNLPLDYLPYARSDTLVVMPVFSISSSSSDLISSFRCRTSYMWVYYRHDGLLKFPMTGYTCDHSFLFEIPVGVAWIVLIISQMSVTNPSSCEVWRPTITAPSDPVT